MAECYKLAYMRVVDEYSALRWSNAPDRDLITKVEAMKHLRNFLTQAECEEVDAYAFRVVLYPN